MRRLALALLCLLTPLAGCSGARAAGPPAPQWGPDADTLGSPTTFMDAPDQTGMPASRDNLYRRGKSVAALPLPTGPSLDG